MALSHRQISRIVTRDMVAQWLTDWEALAAPRPDKQTYIAEQLEAVQPGLSEQTLDVSARDDYADDEVPLIQVVMDDIQSYG